MPRSTVPLSVMQARARAKGYRLKKKGASAEVVANLSPVRPWSEVQAMTPGQKISYRAKLKKWTSRENAYHVYRPDVVVPKSTYTGINQAIKDINKKRERELKRINNIKVEAVAGARNIYPSVQERQHERSFEEVDDHGRPTGRRHEFIGDLYGVSKMSASVPPSSEERANKRLRMFQEMAGRSYEERRQALKENVVTMLEGAGAQELADYIDSFTDNQFDVLTQRTNFMDELSSVYARFVGYKADNDKGNKELISLDELAGRQDMAYLLASTVKKAVH